MVSIYKDKRKKGKRPLSAVLIADFNLKRFKTLTG